MIFRNQYCEKDPTLKTCSGSAEYPVYTADDDGVPVQSGVANMYEEIQSHRESVELSVLLQRYAQGDETALNKITGVYEDIVGAPTSLAEAFEQVREAENSFNSLPSGFRELFGNSPVSFWQEVGTDDFARKVDQFRSTLVKSQAEGGNESGGQSD